MSSNSNDRFLRSLRCPDCLGGLEYERAEQPYPGEYGTLRCGCYRYPVIDGVPIVSKGHVGAVEHVTGSVDFEGPGASELTELIVGGRGREALVRAIAFPATPPRLHQMLVKPRPRPFRRLRQLTYAATQRVFATAVYAKLGSTLRRATLRRQLERIYAEWTVEDWFDLFYRRSALYGDFYPYNLFRFGMPRDLAGLSVLRLFPPAEKPILDLACGFGHLSYHMCNGGQSVVGLDRLFFQVWVAKHWMAPGAEFVCADADRPLPFHDALFSGVFCSDAFSLLRKKQAVLEEFERCAPGETIVLTRVGNVLVAPQEAEELTPEAYAELFAGRSPWVSGERDLVSAYLERRAPDVSQELDPRAQDAEKWLSIIVSQDPRVRRRHPPFESWPHARGTLAWNPIYEAQPQPDGRVRFVFRIPSDWYAAQQGWMREYHAEEVTVSRALCDALERGERPPEVEDLLAKFVVVGMPARYTRGWKHSRPRLKPTGPTLLTE